MVLPHSRFLHNADYARMLRSKTLETLNQHSELNNIEAWTVIHHANTRLDITAHYGQSPLAQ